MSNDLPDQIAINVLGVDLNFRFRSDRARIDHAKSFIENEYERLKGRGRHLSNEQLLMMLMILVTDNFLQSQKELLELDERLKELIVNIESI